MDVDPVAWKQLTIAKGLYLKGIFLCASARFRVNRILSVICFDLSIETALKAVVRQLEPAKVEEKKFHDLIQQADDLMTDKKLGNIDDRRQALYVHEFRNDAQHKAKEPDEVTIQDCRTYSRDFISKLLTKVFQVSLDNLTMASEVRDDKVRIRLMEAEKRLNDGDYEEAVKQAGGGLTWALNAAKHDLVGNQVGADVRTPPEQHNLFDSLERMQRTLLYTTLGIDVEGFLKFRDLTGFMVFQWDGNETIYAPELKESYSREEAEFAVTFAIESVIRIQERIGWIDDPRAMRIL